MIMDVEGVKIKLSHDKAKKMKQLIKEVFPTWRCNLTTYDEGILALFSDKRNIKGCSDKEEI